MKRRLPKIRHGGSVLARINIAPVIADANAHNPGVNTSLRATAALCAQIIATTVAATTELGHRDGTSPPNSIAAAENPDNNIPARARNR